MVLDTTKSFEAEHGFFIDEGSGIWIGGGNSVPTLNAPEGSKYYRTSPSETYTQTGAGFTNTWTLDQSGGSSIKSGEVLVGAFTGNPKKATVTLNTAFSDTNYQISLTTVSTANSNSAWVPIVESKAAGSFVIHLNSAKTTNLVAVLWQAAAYANP